MRQRDAHRLRGRTEHRDIDGFAAPAPTVQAAIEVTMACIAADSAHPGLLAHWIKSEVKVTATKLVMRSTFV